jgi:ferredoxin
MAITRVWIAPGCINCGLSENTCPEIFSTNPEDGSAEVVEGMDCSLFEEEIKQAADECPVSVIHYEEDEDAGEPEALAAAG